MTKQSPDSTFPHLYRPNPIHPCGTRGGCRGNPRCPVLVDFCFCYKAGCSCDSCCSCRCSLSLRVSPLLFGVPRHTLTALVSSLYCRGLCCLGFFPAVRAKLVVLLGGCCLSCDCFLLCVQSRLFPGKERRSVPSSLLRRGSTPTPSGQRREA